jgi:HD superfamily phosphohydrolase
MRNHRHLGAATNLHFTTQLTDPVWGAFPITQFEAEILDTHELCRLEQIKQMGLAFLDFPSLTHTRLEHSLGVMHVADKLFRILYETTALRRDFTPQEIEVLFSAENHQALRLAALLHDLGHPPFSHAVELTFKKYRTLLERALAGVQHERPSGPDKEHLFTHYSHETFTRWMIINARDLSERITRYFQDKGMVDQIAALAVGKAEGRLATFNKIISGDFDADRIDYLIRDNWHSGFSIGLSPDELYNAVHLRRVESPHSREAHYEIYIDRSSLPFVNSVLSARERLVRRVHLADFGRAATQMLINFLHEDLSRQTDDGEVWRTILRLHQRCTDFTFFEEINKRLGSRRSRHHGRDIANIIRWPSKQSAWKQFAQLGFMRMHPCLRLLTYISAKAPYDMPAQLCVATSGKGARCVFIEPSEKPAAEFSILVDYNCNPAQPSLDYIASTENRQGRAILAQSLSNLDVFAYEVDSNFAENKKVRSAKSLSTSRVSAYTKCLEPKETLLARFIAQLADDTKAKRRASNHGMLPSEFLLAVLYCLDSNIVDSFQRARSVYVYRSELFINHFFQSLVEDEALTFFPQEFVRLRNNRKERDANRIFSEVQRLNVFGLIETRQRAIFQYSEKSRSRQIQRTRDEVYSTREDFRISPWGKYYVENELTEEERGQIRELIMHRQGQQEVQNLLLKMATLYPTDFVTSSSSRLEDLDEFHRQWHLAATKIHQKGGCAMIFFLLSEPPC